MTILIVAFDDCKDRKTCIKSSVDIIKRIKFFCIGFDTYLYTVL